MSEASAPPGAEAAETQDGETASERHQTGRSRTSTWRLPLLLATVVVGVVGVVLTGRHYYLTLAEPRYWLPRAADDWAAWGTCIGALFTGGALLFTGFQIRNQVRTSKADRADREAHRLAAARQVQWRVSVKTHKAALQGDVGNPESAIWGPATEVRATIHLPSTRGVTGLAIRFRSTLTLAPYPYTSEYVDAENDDCAIVSLPVCTWLSREYVMKTIGPSNYQYWTAQASTPESSPDGSAIYIDGARIGESLEIIFWTTDHLTDLHLFFTDDSGSQFSLSASNALKELR